MGDKYEKIIMMQVKSNFDMCRHSVVNDIIISIFLRTIMKSVRDNEGISTIIKISLNRPRNKDRATFRFAKSRT